METQYTWKKFWTDVAVRILFGLFFLYVELIMEPTKPTIPKGDWKKYYMYPYHADTVSVSSQIITIVCVPLVAVISAVLQFRSIKQRRGNQADVIEAKAGNRGLKFLVFADLGESGRNIYTADGTDDHDHFKK